MESVPEHVKQILRSSESRKLSSSEAEHLAEWYINLPEKSPYKAPLIGKADELEIEKRMLKKINHVFRNQHKEKDAD